MENQDMAGNMPTDGEMPADTEQTETAATEDASATDAAEDTSETDENSADTSSDETAMQGGGQMKQRGGMSFDIPGDFEEWLESADDMSDDVKTYLSTLLEAAESMSSSDETEAGGFDMRSLTEVPDDLETYIESSETIPDDVAEWLSSIIEMTNRMGNMQGFDQNSDMDDSSTAVSQKGLKADGNITINGGTYEMNTADDSFHCALELTVNGGSFTISSSDDGMHADEALTINDGDIDVEMSYEGLEAVTITVNDGDINVTSSDDGFNANGGSNSFGMGGGMMQENAAQNTDSASSTEDAATDENASETEDTNTEDAAATETESEEEPVIYINGGTIYVNAEGDGLDSNGSIYIAGGDVYVDGPSNGGNSAVDIGTENQGIAVVTGGTLTAIGYSEMAEDFDTSSTQNVILYAFDEDVEEGTEVTISDADGNVVTTFTTVKSSNCIIFSSSDLESGQTYTVSAGDQSGEITVDTTYTSNKTSSGMMGNMQQGGPGNMDENSGYGNMQGGPDGQIPENTEVEKSK